ncbi:hypothetical protein BGZ83_007798 [Gryganskiella cystojenkinii]|nr:hypothetical protein BGZ83_007798 [Gryganskiella cystojenkinii]
MFSTARSTLSAHLCRVKTPTVSLPSFSSSPLIAAATAGFRSQTRFQSTDNNKRVVRDTSYPFPLYFHLIPNDASSSALPSTASTPPKSNLQSNYALSFLPTFPKHNRQIVGYLSHNPTSTSELSVKPNKFTENEAFNTVLHYVIQSNLQKDPMVEMVLQQQLEGWTHIADYRNPAPYGRIPLPEDIFGSVQIVNGVIDPSTYQRMPSHRIASSNGLFQLSDYLHDHLVKYLQNL